MTSDRVQVPGVRDRRLVLGFPRQGFFVAGRPTTSKPGDHRGAGRPGRRRRFRPSRPLRPLKPSEAANPPTPHPAFELLLCTVGRWTALPRAGQLKPQLAVSGSTEAECGIPTFPAPTSLNTNNSTRRGREGTPGGSSGRQCQCQAQQDTASRPPEFEGVGQQ